MCLYKKSFARIQQNRADKFMFLLIDDKIRLKDVPKSVRMSAPMATRIHTAAFRIDRAYPIERFEEDLRLLEFEQFLAKEQNDIVLLKVLQNIEKRAKWMYNILKKQVS